MRGFSERRSQSAMVVATLMILLTACSSTPEAAAPTSSSAVVVSSESALAVTSSPSRPSEPGASTPPSSSAPAPATSAAPPSPSSFVVPAISGPILTESRPTVLEVPSIGVRSDLLDLGQNPDGTIQVPDVDDPNSPAGWYNGSPTPGELGPSILLGHVDSRKLGPGVFYNLDDLQPGAEIRVTREDGTVAIFQVDRVESYSKVEFPTLTVYGNLDHAGLRLITCGGVFDSEAGSYESNIVAFARLVGQA